MVRTSIMFGLLMAISMNTIGNAVEFDAKFTYDSTRLGWEGLGKAGLCVGTLGLAAYGLAKLGGWLTEKSDEQCLDQARKSYHKINSRYAAALTILAQKYAGCYDRTQCIYDVSESTLYQLVTHICPHAPRSYDSPIRSYRNELKRAINELKNHERTLLRRIRDIDQRNEYHGGGVRLRALMEEEYRQIEDLLPDLEFLYDYLDHHRSYGDLFEAEYLLLTCYDQELQAIDAYYGDPAYLGDLIHQAIMLYQREDYSAYPYRHYIERLERDMEQLIQTMHTLAYNYHYRLQSAQSINAKLGIIRQIIVGSAWYAEEIQAYEYARLTEATIAAQQREDLYWHNRACQRDVAMGRHELPDCYSPDCCYYAFVR